VRDRQLLPSTAIPGRTVINQALLRWQLAAIDRHLSWNSLVIHRACQQAHPGFGGPAARAPHKRLARLQPYGEIMSTPFRPLRAMTRHDDPLLAAGIRAALQAAPGIEIVMPCDDAPVPDVDVLICDYDSGMESVRQQCLRASMTPRAPGVVIVTWCDSEADVRAALQAGIGGYLMCNCSLHQLVEAVRCVERGMPYLCELAAARVAKSLTRTPLTLRESEILQLMASGLPNKRIASQLGIALGTVKAHAKAIMDKLGANSRTEATVIAAQRGLLAYKSPLMPAAVRARHKTTKGLGQTFHERVRMAA
jgi:DNA-binding NarL/FixJ family response regulator